MRIFYIEYVRKCMLGGELVNTYHLVTKIFGNYNQANEKFKEICRDSDETIFFSCSTDYEQYDISIRY